MIKLTNTLCLFLCLFNGISFAQKYKLRDIPIIRVEDFQGAKPYYGIENGAALTSMRSFYYFNKFNVLPNGCMRVYYDIKTEQNKKSSWISPLLFKNPKKLKIVLEHEQGHVMIAYLFGNELHEKLNKNYCGNYKLQAKWIFQELIMKYKNLNILYDKETDHSNHSKNQLKWSSKLKRMFKP
ncbi:MAG: hypothetical protein K2Q03_05840 [Sphingobacteriaceae bacterium]|nr:hypothetical protein [Sphingobacteriaceae bacterium]